MSSRAFPSIRFACACASIACALVASCGVREPAVVPPPPRSVAPPATPPDARAACDGSLRPGVVDLDGREDVQWRPDASPRDPSPAVAAACKTILGRRAALEARLLGASLGWETVGRCLPSPKGAWAFDVTEIRDVPPDKQFPEKGWEARLSLVYVTPDGKVVPTRETDSVLRQGARWSTMGVLAAFDYDGDGVSELIVEHDDFLPAEDPHERIEVLTRKGDDVAAYPPAAGIAVRAVVDVDRDGRPDLIFDGPFLAEGPCGLHGERFTGPRQVAHALPDGKLSIDDPVAREVVREQCLYRSTHTFLPEGFNGDAVRGITCARIFGVPVETVALTVSAEYPRVVRGDEELPCLPIEPLLTLAQQTPTFVLLPLCPAGPR